MTTLSDRAMNDTYTPPARYFFGNIATETYEAVFVKGRGKVRYDPSQHKAEDVALIIDMNIVPLPGSRANFNLQRDTHSKARDWNQITKPSMLRLNTDVARVDGQWVQVKQVPTGEKYITKRTGTDGTVTEREVERTAIEFIALFKSEDECRAASEAFFSQFRGGNNAEAPAPTPPSNAAVADPPAEAAATERAKAARFLFGFWKSSGGDLDKFFGRVENDPILKKHFTRDSQEVIDTVAMPIA